MAEKVKRRVAAARLAVAFAAAGAITGAAAWAQGAPPVAKESILVSSLKIKLGSSSIKNGSLLFQDFKKGEIVSDASFIKYKSSIKSDVSTIKGEIGDIKSQIGDIKNTFIKAADADARYIKLTDSVVQGDGSVFTATKATQKGAPAITLLNVPSLVTVDATDTAVKVTNTSGSPLTHSSCSGSPAGELAPGASLTCTPQDAAETLQLISAGAGGGPHVSTLSFSNLPTAGGSQATVQILIGL